MSESGVPTSLPISLTLRDAQSALATLRRSFAASSGEVWHVDAAPIVQLDTSALAVLLECARMAAEGRRTLQIVGAPARLSDLAKLYGVDGLLGIAVEPPAPHGNAVSPVIEPRVEPAPAPER